MLTTRGLRFLLFVLLLLALAVFGQEAAGWVWRRPPYWAAMHTVALIALTLLLWFGSEWLLFTVRARVFVQRLRVMRQPWDARGPVQTLWAGQPFQMRVEVGLPTGIRFPYLTLTDRLPAAVERIAGECFYEGALEPGESVEIRYSLRPAGIGRIRFEGLALQIADLQGFFCYTRFLSNAAEYRVLPALVDTGSHGPTVKRHNLLLPPGIHRHRRPGSGSELLDLRDYLPGDPPKTIAWKVSARRDRLITKEYESEVPVRCTLFIDTSDSVRLGPPGQNALARLVEIGAAVARTATDNRDLTGVCQFDDRTTHWVRPARGDRHLVQLLNRMAEMSGLAPSPGPADVNALLPPAYGLAQEVYPEMMQADLNHFPFWLAWLWPPPPYVRRRPRTVDYLYRWLPVLLPAYAVAGLLVIAVMLLMLLLMVAGDDIPLAIPVLSIGVITFLTTLVILWIPPLFFFPAQRRLLRWRKKLAGLLSVRYGLAPGGLGMLLEDDERMGTYLQRFLAEHHVPYPFPFYDRDGRYLFATPNKVTVLANALLRAVARSHDNELYVLLADLLELPDALEPLLRAVKVALARHHRLLVVCPWPPGVPAPSEETTREGDKVTRRQADEDLQALLERTTTARFHRAYDHVRRTFGRLGVPVVCAQSGDPARLILERLDMLRDLRTKR
jgi:uncharacterized protein (DUF58 family)